MKNFRSSGACYSINSCTGLSKTQFFTVSVAKAYFKIVTKCKGKKTCNNKKIILILVIYAAFI